MTPLIFRAYDHINKEMLYNVSVTPSGHYKHNISKGFHRHYNPTYIYLEVQQYIGLQDSTDKDIYNGDILQSFVDPGLFNWLIEFEDGSFTLVNIGVDGYLGNTSEPLRRQPYLMQ